MEQVFSDYFRWAMTDNPADVGYPHVDPVRKLLGSSVRSIGITDDEALWVDYAMAFLKTENKPAYDVIMAVYRDRRSIRWLESKGRGDRRTIARLASEGQEFVRGVLFGAKIAG